MNSSSGCLLCAEQLKACMRLPYASALDQAEVNTYLYCGNARCVISKSLANELITAHAYTDVRYIPGGYLEWVASQNK